MCDLGLTYMCISKYGHTSWATLVGSSVHFKGEALYILQYLHHLLDNNITGLDFNESLQRSLG